jgi:hypothetical protein
MTVAADPYDFDAPRFADLTTPAPDKMSPTAAKWFGALSPSDPVTLSS